MSTLTRKISSRENHLPISAAMARDGGFIAQIEDEYVAVQSGALGTTIVVERGFLGSARNAHASGATVTPVQIVVQTDSPAAPPPATAGAPQTILRRDFTVNFDDAGVTDINTGVVLWTPVAGEVILDLWSYPVVKFLGGDTAILYIGGNSWYDALIDAAQGGDNGPDLLLIDPPAVGQDFLRPGTINEANQSLDARAGLIAASTSEVLNRRTGWVPTEVSTNGTAVIAAITVTNGPMTAGQLAIRAITAVPA